ncbi:hypothetical protein BVRB_8g190130 [Beta vulgaris subsp. vulgaris]|nr:hypothetical protein BVRB_8g190130 [Beta vulgaris subsp. vulgaris]
MATVLQSRHSDSEDLFVMSLSKISEGRLEDFRAKIEDFRAKSRRSKKPFIFFCSKILNK